ncbi:hypothetical protein Tco_1414679 [Tanacetum coccineum]
MNEFQRVITAKNLEKTLLITHQSLKALDEGYSSKNYVRKFLRALHPKWRERSRRLKILYYLLVEKMYPLTNHTLHQMFNDVKLQIDYECEMAFELLILLSMKKLEILKKNINFRGELLGLKAFLKLLLLSTARVKLLLLVKIEENILSSYYCLYTVNAAGVWIRIFKKRNKKKAKINKAKHGKERAKSSRSLKSSA